MQENQLKLAHYALKLGSLATMKHPAQAKSKDKLTVKIADKAEVAEEKIVKKAQAAENVLQRANSVEQKIVKKV